MERDVIVIVRHGKPALSRKVQLTWRGYRHWWEQYDAGGLAAEQKIPKKVKAYAESADLVISSPLRRAVESAKLASGEDPDIIDLDLVEAPLPSPNLGPLKFNPRIWGAIARVVWFCGWSGGMESHRQARMRANLMSDKLGNYAQDGKLVFVAAHGWYNRMLKGSLKKRGWNCVSQNGDLHWSHRRFERSTGEVGMGKGENGG
jgi:broad specificity phosphatase PhoE